MALRLQLKNKFDEVFPVRWFVQMYKITNFRIVEAACIWCNSKRLFLCFRVLHQQENSCEDLPYD
jgi:hypothetical protein